MLTLNGVTIGANGGHPVVVDNSGTILLDNTLTLNGLNLEVVFQSIQPGGTVLLNGQTIVAATAGVTLENFNDTISGAGTIGTGNGNLTLDNQSGGVVNADVKGATLTIATGATVGNYGLLEATNCATLSITDSVSNYAGAYHQGRRRHGLPERQRSQ